MRNPVPGRTMVMAVAVLLCIDGIAQIATLPMIAEALAHTGFAPDAGRQIGPIALLCGLLLLFRRTSVLGAVLATGFLGGAIVAHVRIDEIGSPLICLGLGAVMWLGLALCDPRVRALHPFAPQDGHSARYRAGY